MQKRADKMPDGGAAGPRRPRKATMKDVADLAGVSLATVSRTLSAAAEVTGPPAQVTYAKMLEAMKGKVLASTDLSVVYTRNVGSGGESETPSPGVPTAGKDPQGGPGAPQGGPGTGQGVPGNVGANRPQAGNGGLRLLPGGAREKLKLTAEQQKQLEDLEVELKSRIERILTPDQLEQLKQMRPPPRDRDAADARPNRPHPNP